MPTALTAQRAVGACLDYAARTPYGFDVLRLLRACGRRACPS